MRGTAVPVGWYSPSCLSFPRSRPSRRALERRIRSRIITGYRVGRPSFNHPIPPQALRGLRSSRVMAVERLGKYLILRLSGGKDLICHLGMSGSISFGDDEGHVRFRLALGDLTVKFHRPQAFRKGRLPPARAGAGAAVPAIQPGYLFRAMRGRRAPGWRRPCSWTRRSWPGSATSMPRRLCSWPAPKLPFGMAQIGKAFRNEIAPATLLSDLENLNNGNRISC